MELPPKFVEMVEICPECCGPFSVTHLPVEGEAIRNCPRCWDPTLQENLRFITVKKEKQ